MMANAVTTYRDNAVSDRNVDANIAAMLAYLETSASQPLPPLALARRTGSQNLPPVRNLLHQPEEIQSQDAATSVARNNVSNRKVSSIAQLVEGTLSNDKASKTADKPLKRGPKGPRKYSAPRSLGPLKPIAPKLTLEEKFEQKAKAGTSPKGKAKKSPGKKSGKRTTTKELKEDPKSAKGVPAESTEDMNILGSMNGGSELELPHFNIPNYAMSASLLGSAGTSVDPNTSNLSDNSAPFRDLHPSHFTSLHSSPHNHPENNPHQTLMVALDYTPETSFSPISDAAPGNFIYHSPAFPTHSGHVTPHSNISPLHSIHNSPQAYRATLDSVQTMQSPIHQLSLSSQAQMFSSRLGNGPSSLTEFMAIEGGFQPQQHYNPPQTSPLHESVQETSGKRKRGNEQSLEQSNGKRRTLKPRTAVTAIQSVLNPANDGRTERNGLPSSALPSNPPPKGSSPKKRKAPVPININATNNTHRPQDSGSITPRLILPDANGNPSDQRNQNFSLQASNSLSMVLNSEAGSALASPQLYEFTSLSGTNDNSNGLLSNSTQRDLDGRLRVQSLLSLPSMSSQNNLQNSPSMQVMQIQPNLSNLLGDPQLQNFNLLDQRRTDRPQTDDNNDPFNLRMMETQSQFGAAMADVGGNISHPASWDILLEPTSNSDFAAEMTNSNGQLHEQAQVSQIEYRPPNSPPTNDLINGSLLSNNQGQFVDESKALASPAAGNVEKRRKRRGKHSRYVAAEGKNGEPDKTHIDVLVKTIQKTEQSQSSETGASAESQYDTSLPSSVDVSLLQNSLPSIETLQLDSGTNSGQTAQERSLLDGMAGIPSSGEPSSNNVSFNMMDFLPENIEWNDLLLPSSNGQVPLPRFPQNQWNPTEYQDPQPAEPANIPVIIPPPQKLPPAKRGRKSKEERKRQEKEQEKVGEVVSPVTKPKVALYHCQYPGCTSKFSQFQHFKTHVDSHEGIKPFRCDFEGCQKNFSQKGNLKAHQRKHTGEKPFVCDECDKAFAQKGNLQTHKMVHTGAKPYVCLIDNCTARYSQRGNLKMHQNKFHTETIQRLTTKAEACSKGGPSLSNEEQKLADHLKILYKFANKGIKGRGKKEDPKAQSQAQSHTTTEQQPLPERPLAYSETLLPPPTGVRDGGASFMGLSTGAWSRDRMDDVFVGSQGHSQAQQQSNNYLGIPGDGGSGGLGGYAFGSLG